MSKSRKNLDRQGSSSQPPSQRRSRRGRGGRQRGDNQGAPDGRHGAGSTGRRGWYATHGRDLRFLAVFGLLMAMYYAASTTHVVKDRFFPWYLGWSARATGALLHAMGYEEVEVEGNAVVSRRGQRRGAISVERGCDAVQPSALFVSAVLASPVPLVSRLGAAAVGTIALMLINLVRITTLFLTAVHWRKAFDVMHLDVWQAAFIFLALLFWALWASWVTRRPTRRADAAA